MSKSSLVRHRAHAFRNQGGRCFYCTMPTWLAQHELPVFAARYAITERQARYFQATAEHLLAESEGGPTTRANIVAACLRCNGGRHKMKVPLDPPAFKHYVRTRVSRNRWHSHPLAEDGRIVRPLLGEEASKYPSRSARKRARRKERMRALRAAERLQALTPAPQASLAKRLWGWISATASGLRAAWVSPR
jgi:hypothetical protein